MTNLSKRESAEIQDDRPPSQNSFTSDSCAIDSFADSQVDSCTDSCKLDSYEHNIVDEICLKTVQISDKVQVADDAEKDASNATTVKNDENEESEEKLEITAENKKTGLNKRTEPIRPPRTKDFIPFPSHSSTEYYNLCNPPPDSEPLPTLPRRKPYITSPDQTHSSSSIIGQSANPSSSIIGQSANPSSSNIGQQNCVPGSQKSDGTHRVHPGTHRGHGTERNRGIHRERQGTMKEELGHHSLPSFTSTLGSERRGCTSRASGISTLTTRTHQYRKKNMTKQRRKGSTCHCREKGDEKIDEVVILYSRFCQGSAEWARYLYKLFTELSKHKGKLTVRHLPVEDIQPVLPHQIESDIYNSRLQLVILSPLFLRWIQQHPDQLVGRLLQQDRVIALLLGVREEQVSPEHRSSLVSFQQWVHLEARDHDLEFVQTVLYFSSQILQRTELKESVLSETFFFTILPRKVTESQNRVVLLLDRPVTSRSLIHVYVDKAGKRVPIDDVKMKNPYTVLATIPVCLMAKSCLVNLYIEVDGENKGFRQLKCEAKQHEMEIILSSVLDPIEFLCQTVSVSSQCKDQLDEKLTESFLNNIPRHGLPLLSQGREEINRKDDCEYPTLLHFSAAHGLEQLTCALLDCPGAQAALQIRNCGELTPEKLAAEYGFHDLAEIIKSHQAQPSKFSHIYDYIKHGHFYPPGGQHRKPSSSLISEFANSDYSGPDPATESVYQVPPPPRPVTESPTPGVPEAPGAPGAPGAGGIPGNYLDMSGSGTPSPSQVRKSEKNRKPGNLRDITLLLHSLEMHMERNSRRILNEESQQRHLWSQIETRESALDRGPLDLGYGGNGGYGGYGGNDQTYHEIPDFPRGLQYDRFGTLRGSQVNRSLREKSRVEPQYSNFNRDPFGTMRAARGSSVPSSSASDVFLDPEPGTQDRVPGHQDRVPGHQDRVPGHQDRVPGIHDRGPENQDRGPGIHDRESRNQNRTDKSVERVDEPDYRGVGEPVDPQLAATDELLGLLEDFKAKSYTVKEMEILFENWRRKVEEPEEQNKNSRPNQKPSSSLLRMFKPKDPNVKSTTSTKKYTKNCSGSFDEEPNLNESEMSVVCLPPTPLKPEASQGGVSCQILPLNRFSSDSSLARSNPPPAYKEPPPPTKSKPIAEVSPFSSKKYGERKSESTETAIVTSIHTSTVTSTVRMLSSSTSVALDSPRQEASNTLQLPTSTAVSKRTSTPDLNRNPSGYKNSANNLSPIREKLMQFRRSITEPLLQYFHEVHMQSPDMEEPDVLNTPKTLSSISEEQNHRLSRRLFDSQPSEPNDSITGNIQPVKQSRILGLRKTVSLSGRNEDDGQNEDWTRHPAPTSQVNEYENISPTPSTDL